MREWLQLQGDLGGFEVFLDEPLPSMRLRTAVAVAAASSPTRSLPPSGKNAPELAAPPVFAMPAAGPTAPPARTGIQAPSAPVAPDENTYSLQSWGSPSGPNNSGDAVGDCKDLPALHEYSKALPLYHSGGPHYLVGSGNPKSPAWMIVNLLPSPTESEMQAFLPGAEGELLRRLLDALRIQMNICYCTWFCKKSRPLPIMPRERNQLRKLLYREVQLVKPGALLLLGETTLHYVLDRGEPLAQIAGQAYEFASVPAVGIAHPSQMLDNPELKKATWNEHIPRSDLFARREA